MTTDYPQRRTELVAGLAALSAAQPAAMTGFGKLHKSAVAPAELSTATKELIALSIGVASQCDGCIAFHVHDAVEAGVTEGQLTEALSVAVLMGGGPAAVYAADALTAYRQFVKVDGSSDEGPTADAASTNETSAASAA